MTKSQENIHEESRLAGDASAPLSTFLFEKSLTERLEFDENSSRKEDLELEMKKRPVGKRQRSEQYTKWTENRFLERIENKPDGKRE